MNNGKPTPIIDTTRLAIPMMSRIAPLPLEFFTLAPDKIAKEQRAVGKTCDLAFGYQGGLNAFRKFSDQFTDEEIKEFNREWRAAHPAIRKFWFDVDRAAWTAVRERGRIICAGPVAFKSIGASLLLRLPSGRKITYPFARAVGDAERNTSHLATMLAVSS